MWSEHERARALALRARGLSIRAVAARVGVPERTVADWLRGRGDCHTVRECELCGARFIAVSARHRFCSPAHQRKYADVFGPPRPSDVLRERASALEQELEQLRARLAAGGVVWEAVP